MVRNYLIGDRRPMTDLMAWNADATRMPCRMHSEYLRRLYLNNDLAEGRFEVEVPWIHTGIALLSSEPGKVRGRSN